MGLFKRGVKYPKGGFALGPRPWANVHAGIVVKINSGKALPGAVPEYSLLHKIKLLRITGTMPVQVALRVRMIYDFYHTKN